jgi:hypothetical protein
MSISQANADFILGVFTARLGDPYVYSGVWSPTDPTQGCDCSGCVGTVLEALTKGPAGMNWNHDVSTESWPFDYATNTPAAPGTVGPYGTIAIATPEDAPADAALIINIMHGGGGASSHMNCQLRWPVQVAGKPAIQTEYLESNGDHGTCTAQDATPNDSTYWTDHWYLPGPIEGIGMRKGLDFAGGYPGGEAIAAAGYDFVCRYVTSGLPDLPNKQLTAAEAADYEAHGIDIVSNWESTGTDAQNGFAAGVADAQQANANHLAVGGPPGRPIYFSLDWDEAPAQDAAVDAYFQGVASVIGLARTGAYGAYWILTRLQAAGLITWAWQTEAWSGSNEDTVLNILQDNNAGYATINGIQCDIDYALTEDFGQWSYQPTPTPGVFMALTDDEQTELLTKVRYVFDQLGPGFPAWGEDQLGNNSQNQPRTLRSALAALLRKDSVPNG